MEKRNNSKTEHFDKILLLSLNETAFANGLIDENTKDALKSEINAKA